MINPLTGNSENDTKAPDSYVQMCRINVMFPSVSDEKSIAVKKVIEEAIKNIPESQVMFTIVNVKPRPLPG